MPVSRYPGSASRPMMGSRARIQEFQGGPGQSFPVGQRYHDGSGDDSWQVEVIGNSRVGPVFVTA